VIRPLGRDFQVIARIRVDRWDALGSARETDARTEMRVILERVYSPRKVSLTVPMGRCAA